MHYTPATSYTKQQHQQTKHAAAGQFITTSSPRKRFLTRTANALIFRASEGRPTNNTPLSPAREPEIPVSTGSTPREIGAMTALIADT